MVSFLFLAFILILVFLAVFMKVSYYRSVEVEPINSPLSRALAEIVSIAGGIYLSLVLVVNFLKINIPETIFIGRVQFDPLAIVALILTIIQAFVLNFVNLFVK
ncbi:MAG: hypothetical protein PWP31_518 [Clostridia bacterium]|nr:hypothetical protein [Clostridia bacterium]